MIKTSVVYLVFSLAAVLIFQLIRLIPFNEILNEILKPPVHIQESDEKSDEKYYTLLSLNNNERNIEKDRKHV